MRVSREQPVWCSHRNKPGSIGQVYPCDVVLMSKPPRFSIYFHDGSVGNWPCGKTDMLELVDRGEEYRHVPSDEHKDVHKF